MTTIKCPKCNFDVEINKVIKLVKEYSKLNVPAQQRINMFDYIKEKWNDRI